MNSSGQFESDSSDSYPSSNETRVATATNEWHLTFGIDPDSTNVSTSGSTPSSDSSESQMWEGDTDDWGNCVPLSPPPRVDNGAERRFIPPLEANVNKCAASASSARQPAPTAVEPELLPSTAQKPLCIATPGSFGGRKTEMSVIRGQAVERWMRSKSMAFEVVRDIMMDPEKQDSSRPYRILDELPSIEAAQGLVFRERAVRRAPHGDLWLTKGGVHGDTYSKDVDESSGGVPAVRLKRSYGKIKIRGHQGGSLNFHVYSFTPAAHLPPEGSEELRQLEELCDTKVWHILPQIQRKPRATAVPAGLTQPSPAASVPSLPSQTASATTSAVATATLQPPLIAATAAPPERQQDSRRGSVKRKPVDTVSSQIIQRERTNQSYITFLETDGSFQGEIAQRSKGAVLRSRNGDFAEWRRRNETEPSFEEGDVVGIDEAGLLTRRTHGLRQVAVISRVAMVEGSVPDPSEIESFDMVAYTGHVPVKLRGACKPGGLIVPSGLEDGTAVAYSSCFAPTVRLGRAMEFVLTDPAISPAAFEMTAKSDDTGNTTSISGSEKPLLQHSYKLATISVFNPVDTVRGYDSLCGMGCAVQSRPRRACLICAAVLAVTVLVTTTAWLIQTQAAAEGGPYMATSGRSEKIDVDNSMPPDFNPEYYGRFEVVSGPCQVSRQGTCVGRPHGYGSQEPTDCASWRRAVNHVGSDALESCEEFQPIQGEVESCRVRVTHAGTLGSCPVFNTLEYTGTENAKQTGSSHSTWIVNKAGGGYDSRHDSVTIVTHNDTAVDGRPVYLQDTHDTSGKLTHRNTTRTEIFSGNMSACPESRTLRRGDIVQWEAGADVVNAQMPPSVGLEGYIKTRSIFCPLYPCPKQIVDLSEYTFQGDRTFNGAHHGWQLCFKRAEHLLDTE